MKCLLKPIVQKCYCLLKVSVFGREMSFKSSWIKWADSVSKNLMGKDGLTGDLTGSPDG